MWKSIVIIAGAFSVVLGEKTPFIFGGNPVTDNAYNFMVYIEYYTNESYVDICSGSIINEKWILTAAHCFESSPNPRNVILKAGKPEIPMDRRLINDLQIKTHAKMIYIHEGYDFVDDMAFDNDIALIELDTPFVLNKNVNFKNYSTEESYSNLNCTVLGFGYTENRSIGLLYQITNNVILPPEKCQAAHNYRLNGHFVCLFNKTRGICQGDSGGPLVCERKIYAISTASTSKISSDEACVSVTESYFLMTGPYKAWIEDKMSQKSESKSNIVLITVVTFVISAILIVSLMCCIMKYKNRIRGNVRPRPLVCMSVAKRDVDENAVSKLLKGHSSVT